MGFHREGRGFSLLEVLVALAVLGVALIGTASGISDAVASAAEADVLRRSLQLGQEGLAFASTAETPTHAWSEGASSDASSSISGGFACSTRTESAGVGPRRWVRAEVHCRLGERSTLLRLWELR